MYDGLFFNICTHDKNLSHLKITVCATFKVSNVKTFYDPGDLVNKIKVKLMTCNQISCHYASWVKISSLHLKMVTDWWAFVYPIGYNGNKLSLKEIDALAR